jgi:alkanesulfonate monooxygenase SsuD/methylene tetrahydromethanopterin reductase-like flavin-dependent oxidoreductase (luciferase family)
MKVFVFDLLAYGENLEHLKVGSELPYPLPAQYCKPEVCARTYAEHLDAWELMDKLGYDGVGFNEHHTSPYGLMTSPNLMAASAAQRTKKLKLLIYGNLLPLHQPLRLAEELAMLDCLSNGRIISGFARGIPREYGAHSTALSESRPRFEEAYEIVIKAWTEEVFSHQGTFWSYRDIAIWPRPVQQPHPPVWSTTGSRGNARVLGERGIAMATLGTGYATRPLYDAYREGYLAKHGKLPGADRFGYLGLVAVADNEAEAQRRAKAVSIYLPSSGIVAPEFRNPPGYLSIEDNVRLMRGEAKPRTGTKDGRFIDMRVASVQDLVDTGVLFCGTPDQVYDQIVAFADYCGGMGNLLMMGHAGPMSHEDTVDNLTLFAKEVLPRLKEYKQPVGEMAAA